MYLFYHQETPLGKKFLAASTMQELAAVFGKEKEFLERQVSCFRFTFLDHTTVMDITHDTTVYFSISQESLHQTESNQKLVRREKTVLPKKRKLSDLEADDLKIDKLEEFTEMYCPFVRGHYNENLDIPKSRLMNWLRSEYQSTRGKLSKIMHRVEISGFLCHPDFP